MSKNFLDHWFVTLSAISIMDYVPFVDSNDNYGTNTNDELLQDWEEDILIVYTNAWKFLGIVGQNPSDSKSNRLHVDIFRFCFIHSRYILLYISLKWSVNLLKSPTFIGYFSNSTISSQTVSLPLFYPETLGVRCSCHKSHPPCLISLPHVIWPLALK